MKWIIILLAVFDHLSRTNSQISLSPLSCNSNRRTARIVGGSEALKNENPHIVSLVRRGGHFCGATILNKNWLITAGHCVCDGLNEIFKSSRIKGVLGLHTISEYNRNNIFNSIDEPFEVDFKNIIAHPDYDCSKTSHDIALLELTRSIEFSASVRPMCIATDIEESSYQDTYATVYGWGWTNEDDIGTRSDRLQRASVRVWDNDFCQQSFHDHGKKSINISHTQMCAGYENGGIDSCWADSGGPLIANDNILIGVVSTGVGCARPGLPGIYTRVSQYAKWIQTVINN